jgi:hypothetical protein
VVATPLDSYAPFDAGPGSNVQENEWRTMMRLTMDAGRTSGNGIVRLAGNEFRVYADSSGSQVKVQTGECWIEGHWGVTFAEKIIPIANGHATNPRIDTVVLRMSSTDNNIGIDILQGVPAGSPTAILPTVNSSIYEIQLAQVSVPALDTIIAANQVFDGRGYLDAPQVLLHSTSDLTVNNSTTFTDVPGFSANISYSSVYVVDGFLEYSAATAADAKVQFVFGPAAIGRLGLTTLDLAAASTTASANLDVVPVGSTASLVMGGCGAADADRVSAQVRGWIQTGAVHSVADPLTNPFSMKVQFAQNTANASNAIMYDKSWLKLTRMF